MAGEGALPVLAELRPELVLVALDSDWRDNGHVARALGDCAKYLNKEGYSIKIEDWDPVDGKGIDNVLHTGGKIQLKPWEFGLLAKYRGMNRKSKVLNNG